MHLFFRINIQELVIGYPVLFSQCHICNCICVTGVSIGQPRIWMSMSRDGLLPKIFSRIHPKYKTPSFSTVLTGFCGYTCFVFKPGCGDCINKYRNLVCVCTGLWWCVGFTKATRRPESNFKVPYVNSKYINSVDLHIDQLQR